MIKVDVPDLFGGTPNGGRDAAIRGVWIEAAVASGTSDVSPATAPFVQSAIVRTGGWAWRFPSPGSSSPASVPRLRMGLGSPRTELGASFGLNFQVVPQLADHWGWSLRDNAGTAILTFVVQTDGSIQVKRGGATGTLLGTTSAQIPQNSWQHIEFYATRSATAGQVEIRLNNNVILSLTGQNTGSADWSVLHIGCQRAVSGQVHAGVCLDDLIVWDKTGGQFNDFPGPKGVYALLPNADTVVADWSVVGAAAGHAAISEVGPDDDASYILSGGAGDVSEFGLQDLPPGVGLVSAVVPVSLMRSPEAAQARVDVVSGASVATGTARFLPTAYDYWQEPVYLDPDTGAPWTRAGVNAARLRFRQL
ncbi:MAG: hypothetical protein ACK4TJ_03695 [Tabrizicola sp.]